MTLDFAYRCAERLLTRLSPLAERIVVAGSIRRRRPQVGDIDLVALPKRRQVHDLFGNVGESQNATAESIRAMCASEGWSLEKDGPDYLVFSAGGIQVDLWFARPETWGAVLLSRTGSKEHNVWLCMRALDLGGKFHPHAGLYVDGRQLGATEEAIYEGVKMPFLDPATQRDLPAFLGVPGWAGYRRRWPVAG